MLQKLRLAIVSQGAQCGVGPGLSIFVFIQVVEHTNQDELWLSFGGHLLDESLDLLSKELLEMAHSPRVLPGSESNEVQSDGTDDTHDRLLSRPQSDIIASQGHHQDIFTRQFFMHELILRQHNTLVSLTQSRFFYSGIHTDIGIGSV